MTTSRSTDHNREKPAGAMDSSRCGSKVSGPGSKVSGPGSMQMQRSQHLYECFLTEAAAGLRFSTDSAVDLGAAGASYSQADFRQLFRPTGALKPSARRETQQRNQCRPAPRPKAPPEPLRDFLPLLELPLGLHAVEPLQGSCRRTGAAAGSSAGHYLKKASGSAGPVHKEAHRDRVIVHNSSKCHNNLQRWSPPASQKWTGPDGKAAPPNQNVTTGNSDLTDLADQVHTAGLRSCPRTGPGPQSGSGPGGLLAAPCPALDADLSTMDVQGLLEQLWICQDCQPPHTQPVVSLLTSFSSQTTLVRSLLAEQLNSCEWRRRQLACATLSSLRGPVNKDVVNKLTHLMWTDQHGPVRLAAAEALMKLANIHVYNQLRLKLAEGRGLQGRIPALALIRHLKVTRLHEPVVSCLRDEFTAVRKQACLTAECLQLKDEAVVRRLLELVESDPVQEVQLSAIRAVGALGLSSSDVQEALLRCVESGEEAELRLAACRLLQSAGLASAQLQDFLLQRVDVEPNKLVRRAMKEELLRVCGCSLKEERRHCRYINLQLQRLSAFSLVTEKLLLLEGLQAGGAPGPRLGPGTLARLLNQHYGIDEHLLESFD